MDWLRRLYQRWQLRRERARFRAEVAAAIRELPPALRKVAERVQIGIAEEYDKRVPGVETLGVHRRMRMGRNRIVLFRRALASRPKCEVQRTLIHELGHELGLSHDIIAKYGYL